MKLKRFYYSFCAILMLFLMNNVVLAGGLASPSVDEAVPFNCESETLYVVQGNTDSQLYWIDTSVTPYVYNPVGDVYDGHYNALGYNVEDQFMYAISNLDNPNDLLKVDSGGIVFNQGPIAGLPQGNWNSGTFDESGNYYLKVTGKVDEIYIVDVSVPAVTGTINMDMALSALDIVWHPNGLIYGVTSKGQLFSVDSLGNVDLMPAQGAGVYGGLSVNEAGNIVALQHREAAGVADPHFYEFDIVTGNRTELSTAQYSINGDMAVCVPRETTENECEYTYYVVQGDTVAQLFGVDDSFNYTAIGGTFPEEYNALGYNSKNGMLYAILNKSTNELLEIHPVLGTYNVIGAIPGLPNENWNAGTFDNDGNYYVRARGKSGLFYKIVGTDGSESLNAEEVTFPKKLVNEYDLVWDEDTKSFWGVTLKGELYNYIPGTGDLWVGPENGSALFGGLAFNEAGNIVGFHHGSASGYSIPMGVGFYEFETDGANKGWATWVANVEASKFGDMTRCGGTVTLDHCDSNIYVVSGDDDTGNLYRVNPSFNTIDFIMTYDYAYNALGYNQKDGLLYGVINKDDSMLGTILRIDPDHETIEQLNPVVGLPTDLNFNSGVFDDAGNYYIKSSGGSGKVYKVNVSVDPPTAELIPLPSGFQTYDLAWDVTEGVLYGYNMNGRLFKFDPNDVPGSETWITDEADAWGSGIFGGLITDLNGNLYGYQHRDGLELDVGFYKIDKDTGEPTLLSTIADAEINGDMAFCGNLELDCNISLEAEVITESEDGCVEEDGYFTVNITLNGSSAYPLFTVYDSEGNEWTEVEIGDMLAIEYPADTEDLAFYAFPTVESEACFADVEVESPEICEELGEGDEEEPCDWIVRVWSSKNGLGTSWSLTDSNGDPVGGVEEQMSGSFNDIEYFTVGGPLTFTLDAIADGYRSVNYNVFRNGAKVYHGRARDEVVVIDNMRCDDGGNRPALMKEVEFSYYPNPVKDVLNIKSTKEVKSVQAFSIAGNQVLKTSVSGNQIDVSNLPSGIYVFRAVLENDEVETFKVVIAK